ncbi:MAG TPA: proton-conducting transporter membrane subunit [Devosia sp.]|nr:proton-conducting transporter membrane subunit [Devosia sp.]
MISYATPLPDWLIVLPVVLGLLGAALLLALRSFVRIQAWISGATVLVILVSDGLLLQRVSSDGPLAMTMGRWLPPFGITFAADVLGAAFAFLSALVTLVVVAYLHAHTPESVRRDGLYALILLLLAGVSGGFLTGDLFNLYVWFEVTLIATFGLMVIAGNPIQLDGAIKYALLNFVATSLFLAALGLLYGLVGTLNMADLIGRQWNADPGTLATIAALFMLALGIKAAAFPVNAWLPASYHAMPPGLSALMAGLLTKLALYALFRTLLFVLPASLVWLQPVILVVAIATMILGPLGAIAETNIRRAFGFMLIGGVGVALSGLALPSPESVSGSILYVGHSMLTVAALYLLGGLAEPADGRADTKGLQGAVAAALLLVILSVAGVPPFLGFWPKLLLLQGILGDAALLHGAPLNVPALSLAAGILLNAFLTLFAGSRLWIRLAWKPQIFASDLQLAPLAASLALATIVTIAGLLPELPISFAQAAAAGLLDPSGYQAAVGITP